MWKFQCKKCLMLIGAAFIIGALVFNSGGKQGILQVRELLDNSSLLSEAYWPYVIAGIQIAGLANGVIIILFIFQKFNLPFFMVFLLIYLLNPYIVLVGTYALIPMVAVYIFGWITMPNRANHKNFAKGASSSVAEVERVFRLHHEYDAQYESLADKAWKSTLQLNIAYAIGLVVLFVIFLYVDDFLIMMLTVLLYGLVFFQLSRKKVQALKPIIALLYDDCNPTACASAIFALAKKSHKKKGFPLPQHLAQCMVYVDDPHLAIDVLVTCSRNSSFAFPYNSLMAYAYYQLGDLSMVRHHYEECEKAPAKGMNSPLAVMKAQCLEGIQNKIDLMEKDFDKAIEYYKKALPGVGFEFQRVDFKYYMGLISFVERDISRAQEHFSYVIEHGGTIYYVQKAKDFLKLLEGAVE